MLDELVKSRELTFFVILAKVRLRRIISISSGCRSKIPSLAGIKSGMTVLGLFTKPSMLGICDFRHKTPGKVYFPLYRYIIPMQGSSKNIYGE